MAETEAEEHNSRVMGYAAAKWNGGIVYPVPEMSIKHWSRLSIDKTQVIYTTAVDKVQ